MCVFLNIYDVTSDFGRKSFMSTWQQLIFLEFGLMGMTRIVNKYAYVS